MGDIFYDRELTVSDIILLKNLADDIQRHQSSKSAKTIIDEGYSSTDSITNNPDTCMSLHFWRQNTN